MSVSNILGVYQLASVADRKIGGQWYPDALAICNTIATKYGVNVYTVAGVMAALSPRNRWERNIQNCENLVKAYTAGGQIDAENIKVCTFGSGKKKAVKLLAENVTEREAVATILNGPKLREFFGCIVGDSDVVCIDGHAYSVWFGDRITLTNVPSLGKKLRASITADYIQAAQTVGIKPSEMQATTWCAWRRIHGVD
jgi:hypothetical protein